MCLCCVRGEEEGNVLAGLQTSLILHLLEAMQSAPPRGYLHTLERHIAASLCSRCLMWPTKKDRELDRKQPRREKNYLLLGTGKKGALHQMATRLDQNNHDATPHPPVARAPLRQDALSDIQRGWKGGPRRRLLLCQRAFSERQKMKNIGPLLLTAGGGKRGRQDHLGVFFFVFWRCADPGHFCLMYDAASHSTRHIY